MVAAVRWGVLLVAGLLLPATAHTADVSAEQAIVDLEVVRGVQPGPGLWKVSKGEHVLWILGTLGPLPKDIEWRSAEVQDAIAHSQQLLAAPAVSVKTDAGFFSLLALLPSLRKAMRNENGARLQQVLPADLYARWSVLKARYLGRDNGVEKKRPLIAADALYDAAIRKSGLATKSMLWPVVKRMAKQAGIEPTPVKLTFVIKDPKAALKELRAEGISDLACFRSMLDVVENDLPTMVERGNAWAVGDIRALQAMPPRADAFAVCSQAVSAEALDRNAATFALLPLADLLGDDGYLQQLQMRGYEIQAP
jgi:uncharacterized protein YbaP (TraB family)